tara:strand:+ start:194 stop:661 length:468 start_codon:yes stop_codon:yes gene_type:complete
VRRGCKECGGHVIILEGREVVLEFEVGEEPDEGLTTVEAHAVGLPGPRGGKRKRKGDQVSRCTDSLDVLAWCASAQAADASEGDPIELETGEGGEGGEGDEKGEGRHAEVFTSHFEGLYGLTPMCSEGELDRILQEQLARLRSSWSNASSWHCSR